LSEEQKAFAKAFRGMQLESSVFGICIIQIKPALERLLNLPDGSLTKEIQLAQDLMSLFVEYQIPSDLLSYDGPDSNNVSQKVEAVKSYVKAVMEVIDKEKAKQLEEEKQKREMRDAKYGTTRTSSGMSSAAPSISSISNTATSFSKLENSDTRRRLHGAFAEESFVYASGVAYPPPQEQESVQYEAFSSTTRQEAQEEDWSTEEDSSGHGHAATDKSSALSSWTATEDFTLIPKVLDTKLLEDSDGALKSTTVKAGEGWYRTRQANLLTQSEKESLATETREKEKNRAMDLLTALSRSGSLPIESSELHVIVALTHCFEQDVMNTVYRDNVNPIEKVESSLILLGSTIHDLPEEKLLAGYEDVAEEIDSEEMLEEEEKNIAEEHLKL
jgi:hypothetical protein